MKKDYSSITSGGENNIYNSWASFIGGGDWNCIHPSGGSYTLYRSFIGGGFENCVQSNNSVFAGGITNSILTSNADAAVIAGGANNTVNAPCGAVLGGAGNTVTHPFAAVFGNGLNSVMPDMFHVSCLNAVNTPVLGGQPLGTLTYIVATPGMVAAGFPVGSKIAMIA